MQPSPRSSSLSTTRASAGAKPTRTLFIGNSFSNRSDLPGMLERLAAAAKPPHRVESDRVIANGQALKSHWERGTARQAIQASKWDYVVLQEQSTLPLKNPARMHEYIRFFDTEIKASGAKTVLYMTWARRHQWERQPELANVYTSIGKLIGAIVVPVGTAWQRLLLEHRDIVLHDKDNSHPNFAGSYLAACVFFSTLFRKSPEGLQTSDLAALTRFGPETAHVLQETAWRISNEH